MPVKEGAGQVSTYRAGLQMGYLSLRNKGFTPFTFYVRILKLKLSDFLLDLHQSLAYQGLAKSLDISIGMPPIFANLAASRSWHIS
jgi:hypothetical protein